MPRDLLVRSSSDAGPAINAGAVFTRHSYPGPARTLFLRLREYLEIGLVIAAITIVGWFYPISYRAFGLIYLLAVIVWCLRVGRGPILFAAIVSAGAWNYVLMPPRLSFSVLHFEDVLILGTYAVVVLIAGQLTARIRAHERIKAQGEWRATALFHLTRGLAAADGLDEAVTTALRETDLSFEGSSALLLVDERGNLALHPASSYPIGTGERLLAVCAQQRRDEVGRFTSQYGDAAALYVPMSRAGEVMGVMAIAPPPQIAFTSDHRDLLDAFVAQIALLIEREKLRAASEREKLLAASDRLHRTLLDSVSHELKTPLAVLRSAAEKLEVADPVRRAQVATEIRTATQRLDRLVANLLHQTRLESGAITPLVMPCEVGDVISGARRGIADMLAGRTVRVELPDDLPLVLADAPLLEQAVANLLLNAVLYTPPRTEVLIGGGIDSESQRVCITVADQGPGLPSEVRQHLFQKFQRGKKAPAGGVGLGLAIVHGFVVAQGGEIVADENPGGGARFRVYLPISAHQLVPTE